MLLNIFVNLPLLAALSERDRRLLIFFLIVLIVLFILIAYIGEGIRKLMQKYASGIDGYMYDLCASGLVKNKKEFANEVRRKEVKRLYFSTKIIFRVFALAIVGFVLYSSFRNGTGESGIFYFTREHLQNLRFEIEVPRGKFFFFDNFIIDFPSIVQGPQPVLSLDSVITYLMLAISIVTIFGVLGSTLRFISRVFAAGPKGRDAFEKTIEKGAFATPFKQEKGEN